MAKTKLKSVFTREDVYTVLQLLKALADGVDTNEELTDADIEKLKTSVDKLNGAVSIAEDNTTTIANGIVIKPTGDVDIGKNLDVDGVIRLNTPDDLTFVTGSLPTSKTYYQHTVTIKYAYQGIGDGNKAITACFTAISTINTSCKNWADIFSVFGGRTLGCSGCTGLSVEGGSVVLSLDLRTPTTAGAYFTIGYPGGDSVGVSMDDTKISDISSAFPLTIEDVVTPL